MTVLITGICVVRPGPCTSLAVTETGAEATRNGAYAWLLMYCARLWESVAPCVALSVLSACAIIASSDLSCTPLNGATDRKRKGRPSLMPGSQAPLDCSAACQLFENAWICP